MGEILERFPLFPLGLVLLPREVAPLHIFEERYKAMVDDCLEGDSDFGILWMGDGGLKDIGCSARVSRVLERMDDGRLNILVEGRRAFRLERRIDDMEYPAGDVEMLEDDEGAENPESGVVAREEYANLVEQVTDSRPEEADLAGLDAYAMAATIAFELDAKQQLLEIRAETGRLDRLASLCLDALRRLEYAQRAAELAKTNGKAHR